MRIIHLVFMTHTDTGGSASHAWQTVVPGAFTSVHRSQVHDVGNGGAGVAASVLLPEEES